MKKFFCLVLSLSFLFILQVNFPAWAEETKTEQQSAFTLGIKDNLISLKAEQASFKEILADLETKTGIKVKIFDGVEDKKVSLNISALPVYAIHTLLEKMGIGNFAVVYNKQLTSKVIYILPAGQDIAKLLKSKPELELLPNQVDERVARIVAEDYLPKYYPGEWVFFSKLIFYDLDGFPSAYALIFRKPTSEITNLQQLEESMSKARLERDRISEQILQVQKSKVSNDEQNKNEKILTTQLRIQKEALYKWNSFATVVTGATETSSLEQSHYKGLPPVFVEKIDLQRSLDIDYSNENLKLGRVLFFDPFDIRYEVNKNSEAVYVMGSKTKKLETITSFRERLAQAKVNDERRRDLMRPEERKRHDKGIEEREKNNISEWQKYKGKRETLGIR